MRIHRLHVRTRRPMLPRARAGRRSRRSRGEAGAGAVEACPVPWVVVCRTADAVTVEHVGETPLHSVRFALAGSGVLGLSLPRTVFPGERLEARVKEVRDRSDAMLVLRWFQPEGMELLWPIAL